MPNLFVDQSKAYCYNFDEPFRTIYGSFWICVDLIRKDVRFKFNKKHKKFSHNKGTCETRVED